MEIFLEVGLIFEQNKQNLVLSAPWGAKLPGRLIICQTGELGDAIRTSNFHTVVSKGHRVNERNSTAHQLIVYKVHCYVTAVERALLFVCERALLDLGRQLRVGMVEGT